MPKQPHEGDLRELPKRPFGVYAIVFIMLLGVLAAVLEIFRVQYSLVGVWAEADEYLRDHSGLVTLAARFFEDPLAVTIINSVIILVWLAIIAGLWLLQRWAWVLLMIVTGIVLTFSLVQYFEGAPDYIGMLTNVAIAFYLNDHSVQRVFARRQASDPA